MLFKVTYIRTDSNKQKRKQAGDTKDGTKLSSRRETEYIMVKKYFAPHMACRNCASYEKGEAIRCDKWKIGIKKVQFVMKGVVQSIRELPYISVDSKQSDEEQFQYKVVIPPVQTTEVNRYICYSKSLEEIGESYITKLLTEPDPIVAPHHIDSGLCLEPHLEDATWDCKRGLACKGDAVEFSGTDNFQSVDKPLYVLPKEPAPPANITLTFKKTPTKYNFQKFLLANGGFIPANKPNGIFAEGFLIRNKTWTYLGGQKTRERHKVWFDVVNGPVEIQPGDILASRCLFINNEDKAIDLKSEDACIFQLSVGYDIQYHEYFARQPGCISNSPDFTFCSNEKTAALCDR
ncbi:PAM [Mytilus coruscus]|uniref:PAM n=1 Tax=Mytilus coruscus TaxID=42192 RepID=A0A6J8BP39_MYTCO|nr:PAM [Mytilus coruscus]